MTHITAVTVINSGCQQRAGSALDEAGTRRTVRQGSA